ncbi:MULTISPECIES: hypothetical protein [Pseudonocardia]|uniref:Uncharacterized protein n=2 Tax=Pseudonocardia TaxID=1847 RepID=A0A1Y2N3K6_PSEAH|nr:MULTISPECIES: hypothetical protein [Pseudonocardia]OSY42055.1 hypothetical protein BG845_01551 [Pseudonocardia autotrophica]TDN75176.1 hypothetical protein C8E95_4320 [Pseudonocardia autotrophica]BBF99121.1 hypothetical protein Pdca_03310 [Pseudonocardia autotrophica]GEC24041.1 hypothetical protein PSA01_10700 [Pseudonocardia saturnea]
MSSTDHTHTGQEARSLEVLRDIWSANARTGDEIEDQLRGNRPKVCRNMRSIGFGGMDPEVVAPGEGTNTPVDTDIRSAWRATLEREGKLHPRGTVVGEPFEPRTDG